MKKKVLITSALPYANGPLHFGHIAGAYLPGDCYARYERLKQSDVLYICGSDEYGVAITLSADLVGRTPREHVDIYHEVIVDFFSQLNLSFDHYSRTTCPGHQKPAQEFFLDLMANGYIEEKETEQLYSQSEEKFLADRYVIGRCPKCGYESARGDECQKCGASYDATDLIDPRSKISGAPLQKRLTKHWFLLLDKFKERLMQWLESKDWKPNVVNFIKGYIREMHPRAITRDSTWGVPLPLEGSDGKVLYVWFDAPIGYISATMEWAQKLGKPDLWQQYWYDPKTRLVQFIGKDNIPFHAAIFPAMVMGQNKPYKLVDELPANEFYNLEGRQFSKSDGWYIDLETFFGNYSADQIRYAIAASAPETSDSEFTWREFQQRCNGDLVGKFGNFANRVLVFTRNHCDGTVPAGNGLEEQDERFLEKAQQLLGQISDSYATFRLRKASSLLMELSQLGNVYFDSKKPWVDAKDPSCRQRMFNAMRCCLECLKILALASYPIIPGAAEKLWLMLGYESPLLSYGWDAVANTAILAGQKIGKAAMLFQKVEEEQIQIEIAKLQALSAAAANEKEAKKEEVTMISIDDVKKLDLRTAKIIAVDTIPKSNKLFKITVDMGSEERTVVSGIRQHYAVEQLVGKNVVIIANLQPVTLMGVESHGMLLAAGDDAIVELVTVERTSPGSRVS